MGNLFLDSIIH